MRRGIAKNLRIGYSLRMKQIAERVKTYIGKYQMIEKEDKVIAGISGGADSVCLFFVLLELQRVIGFSFVAVHVNHGLRGADADADERFVAQLCEKYDIALEIFRVDLELIARKRKQSLEEAGREVRREVFLQVAEKYGGNRIALAHHQNDNAETLLWNLARGTGLQGLGGIRPVNGIWIRPLLCLSRQEIEQYLWERKQGYCTDLTNLETAYTRNKLRHQVLPILEREVNAAAVRHMNETMEQMCELREFVEEETGQAMQLCVQKNRAEEMQEKTTENGYLIVEEPWRKLPAFLQKEVLYQCLEYLSGSRRDWGRIHVETVRKLFDKQVGRIQDLPGRLTAVREYDGVRIKGSPEEEIARETNIEIQIPGVTFVPEMDLQITCRVLKKESTWKVSEIPQKEYTKWLDYDIINCLCIRTRQSGDRIVIDRNGHRQKLKSWFVNEKIPAKERDQIPLIADGQQIVWIVGHRISSAYRVSDRTKQVLQIEIEEKQKKNVGGQKDGRDSSSIII